MATIYVTYPLTASGRAMALGHLDRLGLGAEAVTDTDDAIVTHVPNFAGDEDAAKEHFDGCNGLVFYGTPPAVKAKAPKGSADFPTEIEVGGQIIPVPASAREPQAPPEVTPVSVPPAQDEHAPDTATEPSPGLSGAAQAQAKQDKAKTADTEG